MRLVPAFVFPEILLTRPFTPLLPGQFRYMDSPLHRTQKAPRSSIRSCGGRFNDFAVR